MSSEIWKIGQNTKAADLYEQMKAVPMLGEVNTVKVLTKICEDMNAAFDEVLEDQNDYIIEIDGEFGSLNTFQLEQNEKIKKLLSEIKALEMKQEDGTITDEEREELADKKNVYHTLTNSTKQAVTETNNKINKITSEQDNRYRSKVNIAQDYGETTVEKGTPLAETKVKGGFFRKLFGSTGKNKKIIGERAVEAGNNLLDNVKVSKERDLEIGQRIKAFKKK